MIQFIQFLTNYTCTCLVGLLLYWSNSCNFCSSRCWAKPFRLFQSVPWSFYFLSHTQLVEYVDPHVLFYTLKWPFTYSKKEGFTFPPLFKYSIFEYLNALVLFTVITNILRTQFWVRKRLVVKGYIYCIVCAHKIGQNCPLLVYPVILVLVLVNLWVYL